MKKLSLFAFFVFSLFLFGCGNNQIDNEVYDLEENLSLEAKSDFNLSDCMKGCEMLWDGSGSRDEMIDSCSSLCKTSNAMQTNDQNGCENSEGIMRDSCYSSIAYETLDYNICKKVSEGIMKDTCYASVAEKKSDISICKNIDDEIFKEACEDNIKLSK